jgi:hypothetical protein
LGLELTDPGFDFSVLSQFRTRLVAHDLQGMAFEMLLDRLVELGLVKARGRQRTDATHVVAAVRDLNRLEMVGETLRAALEALAAAAPQWLAGRIDAEVIKRYGARIDEWRLPNDQAKRQKLAVQVGRMQAMSSPGDPSYRQSRNVGDTSRWVHSSLSLNRAGVDPPGSGTEASTAASATPVSATYPGDRTAGPSQPLTVAATAERGGLAGTIWWPFDQTSSIPSVVLILVVTMVIGRPFWSQVCHSAHP